MLTHPCCSIIPEGSTLFSGSWRDGCIGTGPFRLIRFEPEKLLELEANPDYWRTGLPKSDGLRFAFGVPPQEILSGFRSGDFTVATDLLPSDVATLRRDPALAAHYAEMPTLSTYFLAMNSHSGAMTDPALRRQVLESVDVTRYESTYSALLQDLIAMLNEKGIRIKVLEKRADSDFLRTGNADLALVRWHGDYPDPSTFAEIFETGDGMLDAFCSSPELDRLIERGRAEQDRKVRQAIYREIEEILRNKALVLPLFHEQRYLFARAEVEGLEMRFSLPSVVYEKLWIRS